MRGWRQDLLVPLLKGVVLVSYLYHVVACNHGTPFPWKSALQTKVLLIAAFFAWSSVVGRILFFDKSMYYIKKRKGAQPLVHWEYTKGTREKKKKRKENLQS
jgi:Na+/alanine symporter